MVVRLAGGIAHDFNTVLSVILGYSELAQLRLPAESPPRPALAMIRESGERETSLTGQLLAFCRKRILQVRLLERTTWSPASRSCSSA